MVRRGPFRWHVAALLLIGAGSASAAQIKFTGNAEADFPAGTPRFNVLVDNPYPNTNVSDWHDVAQASWLTDRDWISGWNIKDLRVHYDSPSDNLYVGVNFFGVAGDADGDGDPGRTDPLTRLSGGVDVPKLGGQESIAVAIDLNNDRIPDVIAGVPADKAHLGPGTDGFTVATYNPNNVGTAYAFGTQLTNHIGGLAFDPDAQHPDFEFSIKNFSKIPGLEFGKTFPNGFEFGPGLGLLAFAGTPDDIIAGEDTIPYSRVAAQAIPEPASLLAWSAVLAGGAAWGLRRRVERRRRALS